GLVGREARRAEGGRAGAEVQGTRGGHGGAGVRDQAQEQGGGMDRAIDSDAAEGQRVDSCEEEGLEQVKWCAFVERHTATLGTLCAAINSATTIYANWHLGVRVPVAN
ncbi:hypothetical protein THAOC_22829, partial [Thalassiosira oceanica]